MRLRSPLQILKPFGLPAFLCTNLTNIRYLTGVAVSRGYVLVTQRRISLFVDGRYRYDAERLIRKGIVVRDIVDLPRMLAAEKKCGFEAGHVTVLEKSSWRSKFHATNFIPTVDVIEGFRRSKDEEEQRFMKKAYRITKEILRRVPAVLRKGISEERLARQFLVWALELGADGLAFDPIVAFGTNTGVAHHAPSSRILQRGHIVQVDVGVKYRDYCSDVSRVFFTQKPTREQQRVYDALLTVHDSIVREVKAGVTNHALDVKARDILRMEGLDDAFDHALGHGLGLEIHEGVVLSQKRKETKLLSGEVVTVEPGVYFPGKFGMRIEDVVFVD